METGLSKINSIFLMYLCLNMHLEPAIRPWFTGPAFVTFLKRKSMRLLKGPIILVTGHIQDQLCA
uniref:Uncharacterized protein n=1 Tax=Arundo donax TaxID=35708 RepID=A0A0A8YN32_ARUDO